MKTDSLALCLPRFLKYLIVRKFELAGCCWFNLRELYVYRAIGFKRNGPRLEIETKSHKLDFKNQRPSTFHRMFEFREMGDE